MNQRQSSESEEAGIAERTLNRAKKTLRIHSGKASFAGNWQWSLPAKIAMKCEGCHKK